MSAWDFVIAWNFDISAAPLTEDFINTKMMKNPETGERCALPFNDTRRVDLILASKCGKVIKTYWIPDENRFAGFQPGEEIVGWMPWPKHPYEAAPDDAVVTSGNDLRKPVAAEQGQIIREGDAPRETDRASGDASCPDTHHISPQEAEAMSHYTTIGGYRGGLNEEVTGRNSHPQPSAVEPVSSSTEFAYLEDVGSGA